MGSLGLPYQRYGKLSPIYLAAGSRHLDLKWRALNGTGKHAIGLTRISFIRHFLMTISIPVAGLLVLNGLLTVEAATILAAATGYAFGKSKDS